MLACQFALPAALLLLLATAAAAPAADSGVAARQAANPTEPWVTVDESGTPKTVTPVATTVSGKPTLLFAAPYDVTATVFTKHPHGVKTTSTGAAQPGPTNKNGAGAFAACHNTDGQFRPFCLPKHNDVYYPGPTRFVTWDTSFFPASNTTLKILGFYTPNTTTPAGSGDGGDGPPLDPDSEPYEEAFSSGNIPAGWGFYQWPLDKSLLRTGGGGTGGGTNITLYLVALPARGRAAWYRGPTVTLRSKPGPPAVKTKKPDEAALYVALPLVFGLSGLMIAGTYYWNRQARQIGIRGSIMGGRFRRRRVGGIGAGGGAAAASKKKMRGYGLGRSSRSDRARDQEQSIRLMGRDGRGDSSGDDDGGGDDDWEQGWQREAGPARGDSEEIVGMNEDTSRKGRRAASERLDRKHR